MRTAGQLTITVGRAHGGGIVAYGFDGSIDTKVNITLPTMVTDFSDSNLVVFSKDDTVSDLRVISQSAYNALDKSTIANNTVYLVYE